MKSPLAMTAENEFNQRNNDATTEEGEGGLIKMLLTITLTPGGT